MQEQRKNISISSFIDLQIDAVKEIILLNTGKLQLLYEMKQSVVKETDEQTQEKEETYIGSADSSHGDSDQANGSAVEKA